MTDHIGRFLSRRSIRPIFKLTRKIPRPVKDARDPLSLCRVYRVPSLCRQLFIGTTKPLLQSKAAREATVALANADHRILFEETRFLSSESAYFLHLHMESVQIPKPCCDYNESVG